MKLQHVLPALLAGLCALQLQAQTCTATLCGTVTEAESGEPVPYAEIFIAELNTGQATDVAGKFHFHDLCDSTYTIVCRHVGCEHLVKKVVVAGNIEVQFELRHEALQLQEITVREKAAAPLTVLPRETLEGTALEAHKGQTLADALRQLPGLSTLQTGGTIVKPVIRGLHSNRILLLNNGVRQEGQQ